MNIERKTHSQIIFSLIPPHNKEGGSGIFDLSSLVPIRTVNFNIFHKRPHATRSLDHYLSAKKLMEN